MRLSAKRDTGPTPRRLSLAPPRRARPERTTGVSLETIDRLFERMERTICARGQKTLADG